MGSWPAVADAVLRPVQRRPQTEDQIAMVVEILPDPDLRIFVPGGAKTKGSQTWMGPGRVVQSVEGSTAWAIMVAEVARQAWAGRPALTGALWSSLAFVLPGDPIAPRAGDLDKLIRNVWDALQPCGSKCPGAGCKKHAGVIADDVLIVSSAETKRRTTGPSDPIGVRIAVSRVIQ